MAAAMSLISRWAGVLASNKPASECDFIGFVGVILAYRCVEEGSRCPSHSCSSSRLIGSLALNNCVAVVIAPGDS